MKRRQTKCGCGVRLLPASRERGLCDRCWAPVAEEMRVVASIDLALRAMQAHHAQTFDGIQVLRKLREEHAGKAEQLRRWAPLARKDAGL